MLCIAIYHLVTHTTGTLPHCFIFTETSTPLKIFIVIYHSKMSYILPACSCAKKLEVAIEIHKHHSTHIQEIQLASAKCNLSIVPCQMNIVLDLLVSTLAAETAA